jgi:hypothetical protein
MGWIYTNTMVIVVRTGRSSVWRIVSMKLSSSNICVKADIPTARTV